MNGAVGQILDVFDYVSNNILMPIVAIFTCILIGWVAKPKTVIDEVTKNGEKFGRKYKIFPVTAVTGEGTEKLIEGIFSVLETLPPVQPVPVEEDFEYASEGDLSYEIVRDENGVYVVMGGLVDMLCRNVVLNNPDSMQYFQKVLRSRGVIQSLKDAGCGEGDTVSIGDVEFDFVE